MLYPDFKMRYTILAVAEMASSSDNKVATYALMDKIGFDRQRYRLGELNIYGINRIWSLHQIRIK